MGISKLDLMRLSQSFDGEFDIAEFTEDELNALIKHIDGATTIEELRQKYFEFYDDIKDRTLDTHKWSN